MEAYFIQLSITIPMQLFDPILNNLPCNQKHQCYCVLISCGDVHKWNDHTRCQPKCMRAYMHMLAGSNTTILELLSGKNGGRCCKKTKHTLTLPCPSGCCNWGGYGRHPVDQRRSHIAGRERWGSGLAMGINMERHAYAFLILVLTLSMALEDSTLKVIVIVIPVRRQGKEMVEQRKRVFVVRRLEVQHYKFNSRSHDVRSLKYSSRDTG